MYATVIPDAGHAPARVDMVLDLVASGLDARFVDAGAALARAYDIVEKVIADLGGVADAIDRDAAARAVANMQQTAQRLERLPETMAARADALVTVEAAGKSVQAQILRVDRTLEFLRICGLNIKVAAGGRNGFSEFADAIFAKLDVSEKEISGIGRELSELISIIPSMNTIDRALAAECGVVIPGVPRRLAADALGLQEHLQGVAEVSEKISAVAHEIRAKLGDALGAIQIGDITRQRLEHVAAGYRLLIAEYPEGGLRAPSDQAVEGHVLALLSAQACEAIEDFRHESQRLVESLRAIVPEVVAMLALQNAGGPHAEGEAAFLDTLERSVAEVGKVTTGLRDADSRSHALGRETEITVKRLGDRLQIIHQVTSEVDNMAWNTDLRCYRMGREGNGLARIAAEIRSFVSTLTSISALVGSDVGRLNEAALAIAQSRSERVEGETLEQSLATIRDGAQRMRENLSHLEGDAGLVAKILDNAVDAVDCEATFKEQLDAIIAQFLTIARPLPDPETDLMVSAQPLLGQIAQLYTMAKERAIHQRFASLGGAANTTDAPAQIDEDLDDGLF